MRHYFSSVIAYIALGGALGTLARYFLQGWVQERSGLATFPVGTLTINLVGSFRPAKVRSSQRELHRIEGLEPGPE